MKAREITHSLTNIKPTKKPSKSRSMRITLLIFGSSRMFAPLKGGLQCISIFGKSQANFNIFSKLSILLLRQGVRDTKNNIIHHKYSSQAVSKDDFHFPVIEYSELHESSLQKVGVIFDIDGVLVRGRRVIGSAREAISKLKYHNVPILYLTNAGCETEEHKARSLQDHIGVEVCVVLWSLLLIVVFYPSSRLATRNANFTPNQK